MEHELEITVKWENEKHFTITEKEDGGAPLIIGKFEENGELNAMWALIQKTMEMYFKTVLTRIGEEMKS